MLARRIICKTWRVRGQLCSGYDAFSAPRCPTLRAYSAVIKPAWKKYAQRPIPVKFVKYVRNLQWEWSCEHSPRWPLPPTDCFPCSRSSEKMWNARFSIMGNHCTSYETCGQGDEKVEAKENAQRSQRDWRDKWRCDQLERGIEWRVHAHKRCERARHLSGVEKDKGQSRNKADAGPEDKKEMAAAGRE